MTGISILSHETRARHHFSNNCCFIVKYFSKHATKAYLKLCQTSIMELSREKNLTTFRKKLHHKCLTGSCFSKLTSAIDKNIFECLKYWWLIYCLNNNKIWETKKVLTILNKVNVRYNYNSVHNILEFYKILVQVPFITSKIELAI